MRLLSFWVRVDRVFHTDDDEKPFEQPLEDEEDDDDEDEDLVLVQEDELRKKKARLKGARANRDPLQEASEDAEKSLEFLDDMKARYEKDPEGVAAEFKTLIDNESTRPAIEAIMKHGMCECAGAHGNLCAWILMMWMAATQFRLEHGDAAPERLASMDDGAVSSYLVDARVEIKVLRRLHSLICAQARSMKQIPNLEGDVRAQLETAASGAWDLLEGVSWPPEHSFKEDDYRSYIARGLRGTQKGWSGTSRTNRLDLRVVEKCGTSHDDLLKMSESDKINLLVEKRRALYVSPFQRISGNHELFEALVAYPTTLDEMVRLVKTIVAMAHGDTLFTNRHCVVVDARVVLKRRGEYLEAERKGKIGNLENFYSGPDNRENREFQVGKQLTRLLMKEEDLPECLKKVRGRISIFGEGDTKLKVDSLLTAAVVAPCYVLCGAVRDVENPNEPTSGRIVAACLVEGELWHVLGTPGHFAMLNPFTLNCFMKIATKFLPVLALGPHQRTSLVPRLKMVTSDDGGVIVGGSGDSLIKADVKSAFPKTIRQMDGVFARAVKVIGENQISNASAHLLAARVVSASSSGALVSLESRDDGLGTGFGVDVNALTKLIDSMKDVVDVSKAVGPLRHILCSCPTPPPQPPQPPPQPQPTNQNPIDLRNGWSHAEWNGWAAEDEDGDG